MAKKNRVGEGGEGLSMDAQTVEKQTVASKSAAKSKPARRTSSSSSTAAATAAPTGLVVTSNNLVHAKYTMTLWQKRLFAYAVSQIPKEQRDFSWQRVYYVDLINFFESKGGKKVYDAIREAPKMLDMTIEVPYLDEKGQLRYAYVKLLSGYTIPGTEAADNRYLEIKFNDDLKPHLLDLREQFMRYDLDHVRKLRSSYSFRIYELLKSHEYRGSVEFTIDYLKDILQLKENYKLYADFRRNIIDRAKNDLELDSDISFEYTERKKSKRVESLIFKISRRAGSRAARATEPPPPTAANIALGRDVVVLNEEQRQIYNRHFERVVQRWGVSNSVFLELVKNFDEEAIERAARVTARKAQSGDLESKAGFFVEAVRRGFSDEAEAKNFQKNKADQYAQKLENLRRELFLLDEQHDKRQRDHIRELTQNEPEVAEQARQAILRSTDARVREKLAAIENPQPTIEDFRKDMLLVERMIDEILRQNAPRFQHIEDWYRRERAVLQGQIDRLQAG